MRSSCVSFDAVASSQGRAVRSTLALHEYPLFWIRPQHAEPVQGRSAIRPDASEALLTLMSLLLLNARSDYCLDDDSWTGLTLHGAYLYSCAHTYVSPEADCGAAVDYSAQGPRPCGPDAASRAGTPSAYREARLSNAQAVAARGRPETSALAISRTHNTRITLMLPPVRPPGQNHRATAPLVRSGHMR